MNLWKSLLIALSLFSTPLVAQEAAPEQFKFSLMGKPLPELKLEEGDRWFHATKGLSVAASPLTVVGRGKPLLVAYTIPG